MTNEHYSVDTMIIENGKRSKGKLILYLDKYVFNDIEQHIDWEHTGCTRGTIKVRSFIFSSLKTSVMIKNQMHTSPAFIMECHEADEFENSISDLRTLIRNQRAEEIKRREEDHRRMKAEELKMHGEQDKRSAEDNLKQFLKKHMNSEEYDRIRLEAEETKRREEERRRLEDEALKQREEEERRRLETEALKKREEERRRLETEVLKKREEEQKRFADDSLKRLVNAQKKREEEVSKRIEAEKLKSFLVETNNNNELADESSDLSGNKPKIINQQPNVLNAHECFGIEFIVPSNEVFSVEQNDKGDQLYKIAVGKHEDDGEIVYDYNFHVEEIKLDSDSESLKIEEIFESISKNYKNSKYYILPGTPHTMFLLSGESVNLFGHTLKVLKVYVFVMVNRSSVVVLRATKMVKDEEVLNLDSIYESMQTVAGYVRVNGENLPVNGVTTSLLYDKLRYSFEEEVEAYDYNVHINLTNNDDVVTLEFNGDGTNNVRAKGFKIVDPDESLYPHYESILYDPLDYLSGNNVTVIHKNGMELEFQKFSDILDHWDEDEEYDDDGFEIETEDGSKTLYRRINDLNPGGYKLAETAKKMIKLFRVEKSVFVNKSDRECELIHGFMHSAYLISAIRSFAWTLADYCKENALEPESIDASIPSKIAEFIAERKWLNYDERSYCKGLCSGSDLHVYYLPDSVSPTDKNKFLPSQEERDEYESFKRLFPNYNEILCEVHSLDALRRDLEYIYPAVKVLYDQLEVERDHWQMLSGCEADIVYAWIGLAMAAEGPFFTEDGPLNYYYDWPGDGEYADYPASINQQDNGAWNSLNSSMSEFRSMLDEGNESLTKYRNYLEAKESRENAKKEDLTRKKEEAIAAGRSEKDVQNMYIIMCNEKKLGKLKRSDDEFCELYEDVFLALSNQEIEELRQQVLKEIGNGDFKTHCEEEFKKRTVEERFLVSTKNLFYAGEDFDLSEKAKWAIENTKEWFIPKEYDYVRRVMDDELSEIRSNIDAQLSPIDASWTDYSNAKASLQIVLNNKNEDDSDLQYGCGNFQVVAEGGEFLISVQIVADGLIRTAATVTNELPWYWGVAVRDIWIDAARNTCIDERSGYIGQQFDRFTEGYKGRFYAAMALNELNLNVDYEFKIEPHKCKGCTLCAKNCHAKAIDGKLKEAHIIIQSACLKCGICTEICKFNAIYKE